MFVSLVSLVSIDTLANPADMVGYMSADMSAVCDWHGNVIGTARVRNSWAIPNNIHSDRMFQVECTIAGVVYTGRTLGASMLWRGKRVSRAKSGFALLTRPEQQPKAVKGQKKGYMTFVLHLAPADVSGYEVCPGRSDGCTEDCLFTAGRGRFDAVRNARIRKTVEYFERRAEFMAALHADIAKACRYAERRGFEVAIRPNGTSDIPWHRVPVAGHANIMECFPQVQFYDYTKVAGRILKHELPANYHLTFSLSEDNDHVAADVLRVGGTVAMVCRDKAMVAALLAAGSYTIAGFAAPVVDGDETDLRFLDPVGSIVLLYAKGRAKNDQSGFVRDL